MSDGPLTGEIVPSTAGPRRVAVPETSRRRRIAAAWLAAQLSEQTKAAYKRDIDQFFAWADEFGVDVLTARRVHVDGFRACLDDGTLGRHYEDSSIARKLAVVSSFYRYAMSEDAVQGNPVDAVKRPPAADTDTPWLTVEELRAFFAAADQLGPPQAALARVLYYSALRVSELCNAATTDLRIIDGEMTIAVRRKGRKRSRVTIAAPAAAALRRHLGTRTGPLFLFRGQKVRRHQVAYQVARIAREAGLGGKNLTPHGLRHSFVTHMLRDGVPANDVREHVGHSRIETTIGYLRGQADPKASPTHRAARVVEGVERGGQ